MYDLKRLVTYFKKGTLNDKFPNGKAIQQELPTRFRTTFDIVKRFVFAALDVVPVIETANEASSSKAAALFDQI